MLYFQLYFVMCKNERTEVLNSQFCNSGFSHSSLNRLYRCQNCVHELSQVSSSWRIFSLLTQKKSGHCHAVSIDSWTRGTHFENLLLWTLPTTRLLFTEVEKQPWPSSEMHCNTIGWWGHTRRPVVCFSRYFTSEFRLVCCTAAR